MRPVDLLLPGTYAGALTQAVTVAVAVVSAVALVAVRRHRDLVQPLVTVSA